MKSEHKHSTNDILARKYQQGQKEALPWLIKRFHSSLTRIILYYTKDHDPVKDIAQECWVDIIHGLENGSMRTTFDPWALAIARNKAIDWVRVQRRERIRRNELINEHRSKQSIKETDTDSRNDKILKLRNSIAQLPNTQRIILSLFYLENHTIREISQILTISEGTVKSRLYNARENLKNQMNR
ncbi:RNA polymerase sigma factor [Balneola sp. MJW-20]|uniref:RNA polymerase sigma factor n=1 Tax=Gracilimonas aurantiaca TaxID=3234185 RepID=UPI003464FC92